ncbi:MAG: hypothetical protein GAK28_00579 [Luteibacter sp.]|uniref:hypothetical protein n=1 Tax=Luteibacter sp. TaxID=1886636 RepID=UPI00137D4DFD|nr:hypothetical protein [Luteibacter sp.]KAF1008947.1 MAG: hypothetical protein GAK28_00579 [Luteibacter sp.]
MSERDAIAAAITGAEYPFRLSAGMRDRAKAAGVVIVYGASDDLMEFDGAYRDEVGAWEGVIAYVDSKGALSREEVDEDDDEAIADFVNRRRTARTIEAVWDTDGYSWIYRTDIPHATFEITDDGEPYCRGIVFNVADL